MLVFLKTMLTKIFAKALFVRLAIILVLPTRPTWMCSTRKSYRIWWVALVDKSEKHLQKCISTLFWEFPECTEDTEVEWRVFKAAAASSAAQACRRKQLICVANNGNNVTPWWNLEWAQNRLQNFFYLDLSDLKYGFLFRISLLPFIIKNKVWKSHFLLQQTKSMQMQLQGSL